MKKFLVLLSCAILVSAAPYNGFGNVHTGLVPHHGLSSVPQGQAPLAVVPSGGVGGLSGLPSGGGTATGASNSQLVSGTSTGPLGGTSDITQQTSSTGGTASGGGTNIGNANAQRAQQTGLLGTSQTANTDATSNQFSNGGLGFAATPGIGSFGGQIGIGGNAGAGRFGAGLGLLPGSGGGFVGVPGGLGAGFGIVGVPGGGFAGYGGAGGGTATGASNSQLVSGTSTGPLGGTSDITQQTSGTGGTAFGGGTNIGNANAQRAQQTGLFGTSQTANTDATSNQFSNGGLGLAATPGIPGGFLVPGAFVPGALPLIPGGTATGKSDAGVVSGTSTGPGGSSTITTVSASAGGSAEGGASSVNSASAGQTQQSGLLGSSTTSNTDASSIQTSSPGIGQFNPNLGFY